MAAVNAKIDASIKDEQVKLMLAKIDDNLRNLKPAMEIIGEIVTASVLRNFEVGGRPKWAKLSVVTKAIRRKKGKWPGQILRQSGALSKIVYQASNTRAVISANEEYAATQHFGAKKGEFGTVTVVQHVREHMRKHKSGKSYKVSAHSRTRRNVPVPWGDIPARRFMLVQKEDRREITTALEEYIIG